MDNKLITICVTLVVGVILAGSVLMPVVNNSAEVERTFNNEGLWRMAENDNGMVYTHDASVPEWALNDDVILSGDVITNNPASNVILGDNWLVRANGWIRGTDLGGNNTSSVTVNIDADTITLAGAGLAGTTTQAISGYGYASDGAFLMTAYDKSVYVKGDSPIYATGLTGFSNNGVYTVIHIEGSIDDGVTITVSGARNNTVSDLSITNVVIHKEAVAGFDDLYKLSGITADVSFTGQNGEADPITVNDSISYSSYVVPYEVTAERSVHFTPGENALIGAIPIMVVIALVMFALGGIYLTRKD